jgi:hypothetical protein
MLVLLLDADMIWKCAVLSTFQRTILPLSSLLKWGMYQLTIPVRFEVLMVMRMMFFSVVMPCRLICRYQHFRETYYLHFQGSRCIAAVMMLVPKALAVFALQWPFQCIVCFHLYLQTTELGEWLHYCHIRASHHRHKRCGVSGRSFSVPWSCHRCGSCMKACIWMCKFSISSQMLASGMRLPKFFNSRHMHHISESENV